MAGRKMSLVDTHCHLDLYENPQKAIREIEESRTLTVAVTNIPSVYPHIAKLVGETAYVRVALGFHPELVHSHEHELPLFRQALSRTRYVGEVGLDYVTADVARRKNQRRCLEAIVEWSADAGDKIVTVHSRRAANEVVDVFGEFNGTYILHWYSGPAKALHRALANGAYVSVNPAMIRSKSAMVLLAQVPVDRVLTETDGPFVRVDGRPAMPADVALVVRKLAALWKVDHAQAQARVHHNFARILRRKAEPPTSSSAPPNQMPPDSDAR